MKNFFFHLHINKIKILFLSFVILFSLSLLTACGKKTTFDDALEFSEDLAAVKLNGFYGYVDSNLNKIIELQYNQAKSFHNGVALVKKASNWGAINKKNEVVIPFKYQKLPTFSKDLVVVNNYSKFGCIDYNGNVLIDFKYDNIELYTYYKEINTSISSEDIFNSESSYKNFTPYNYALTYLEDKVGFIDLQTFFTLEPKYSSIDLCPTDNTILSLATDTPSGTIYGFADLTSKTILEPKFYYPLEFSEGLAATQDPNASVHEASLFGYIDKTGEFVIKPAYNYATKFSNGLAAVEDLVERKFGYINKDNEYVIPPSFEEAFPFQNGSAIVNLLDKYTMINPAGEYITDDYFYGIQFPNENFLLDNTIGFALSRNEAGDFTTAVINNLGEILFYSAYDHMGAFQKNTCLVGQNNKYGCINKRGIEIIPLIYDSITYTNVENVFMVESNKKYGILTINNEELLPCSYDSIEIKSTNYLILLKDNKYGVYDIETQKLIEPNYDEIHLSLDSNIISVRQGNEWFFINANGDKIK